MTPQPSAFQKLINGVSTAAAVTYILWPRNRSGPGLANLTKDVAKKAWKHRRWYLL